MSYSLLPQAVWLAHFHWESHFMQFHKALLREFARAGWETLWVGSPISLRELKRWAVSGLRGQLEHDGWIWRYRPWGLPGLRFGPRFWLPQQVMVWQLRRVWKRIGLLRPVIFLVTPAELQVAKALPHSAIAYWTGDEVIMRGERELLEYADLILAISPVSYEEKRTLHPAKTVRVSTGVDFPRFAGARGSTDVPPDLRGIRRPVIGYAGNVSGSRIDLDLVTYLARRNPEYSVVLVGPVDGNARRVFEESGAENIVPLGLRPHHTMPSYIRNFDVCIIPYLLNRFNLGCNPLKLYEYLALGRPVVSTRIPAVQELGETVWVAGDREEFDQCVKRALTESDLPGRVEARVAAARKHSTEAVAHFIQATLRGRGFVSGQTR